MYQDAAKTDWQNFRGFYPPKEVFSQPLGPKKVFQKLRCTDAYRGSPPYARGLQPLKEDLQKYMSVSQGRKGPTESEF